MTTYNKPRPDIETLIRRSSFGTPEARALRSRTPREAVDKIMTRLKAIEERERKRR
jgi:hypothetical protein